ncbi:outer membrane lipoprotein-sorting protein [Paenibacillus pinihumi]|uniref:outer membrane lipoprotein-sorting protein n=1 Tax=Paenibacillus pinihumi TaxID=669462 RepID=UPI000414FB31|nr:outer membrane lipoprotein-sorting protein [Paenibacillus pinihumi]
MRRIKWIAAVIVSVTVLLAGCGTKDAESVVKDLGKVVSDMESYKGTGTMTLLTGQQPLEYQVEVWYQKPDFYRIALKNKEKDISQIVLRNDDGVFVLTPHLNKSFRFQSDWPKNQGQVYLYQTLVESIKLDNSRQFTTENEAYVFDVMANYQNGSLARQKIWLNKKDYRPDHVQVSDANGTVVVEVKFDSFEFGPAFEKDAFDMAKNMEAATKEYQEGKGEKGQTALEPEVEGTQPSEGHSEGAITPYEVEGAPQNGEETGQTDETGAEPTAGQPTSGTTGELSLMEPTYLPEGVALKDMDEIVYGGNQGFLIRYSGTYDYTLIQTQPKDKAAAMVPSTTLDLGFTVGFVTGEEQRTLTWISEGAEYRLTSANLPETEMIKVAQSVQLMEK